MKNGIKTGIVLALVLSGILTANLGMAGEAIGSLTGAIDAPVAVNGTLVISEIMANPAGDETSGEWIELYNPTNASVNSTGWSLGDQDGEIDIIFPELVVGPKQFVIVFTGSATDTVIENNASIFFMEKGSSIWSNAGDDALLCDESEQPVDYVCWGSGTSIDVCPDGLNWSGSVQVCEEDYTISLFADYFGEHSNLNWNESIPTPGTENLLIPVFAGFNGQVALLITGFFFTV